MFTFDPEGFAAGRQDVRLGCLADDAFGQRRHNADHVLAIVEHKEDLPVTDKGQQTNERVLVCTINPSADATAVGTSCGSVSAARSMKNTASWNPSTSV